MDTSFSSFFTCLEFSNDSDDSTLELCVVDSVVVVSFSNCSEVSLLDSFFEEIIVDSFIELVFVSVDWTTCDPLVAMRVSSSKFDESNSTVKLTETVNPGAIFISILFLFTT